MYFRALDKCFHITMYFKYIQLLLQEKIVEEKIKGLQILIQKLFLKVLSLVSIILYVADFLSYLNGFS